MKKFLFRCWVVFSEQLLLNRLLVPLARLLLWFMSGGRSAFDPSWEPVQWDLSFVASIKQKQGYRKRSNIPIQWCQVPYGDFPKEGLIGKQREWFMSNDVAYIAKHADEELILIRNTWHGFPDPPEWGLASRVTGEKEAKWMNWGHFPDLPSRWIFPGNAPP